MGASIAPLLHGKFGLGFVRYQIPNLQEASWDFSSKRILTHNFTCHRESMEISLTLGAMTGPGPKVIGTYYRC